MGHLLTASWEKKNKKIPQRRNLNLSSSIIWCHQVVSVIFTPLKTREETGEEGGGQDATTRTLKPHVSVVSFPFLRVIMTLKSFIIGLRANVVSKKT